MKKFTTLILPILILISACDNKETIGNNKFESSTQKDTQTIKVTTIEKNVISSVPEFTLACSVGGGQPWYRITSKNDEIYFASVVNESNIKNAKKSFDINTKEREFNIQMKTGEDDTVYYLNIDRSTLAAEIRYFVSKQMYPPDGFSSMQMSCETSNDSVIFDQFKAGYESTLAETQERKRQYDSRPNKI
jgi:hypothetical protein